MDTTEFLGLGILLAYSIFAYIKPRFALALLAALFPFYLWKLPFLKIPFTAVEIAVYGAFGGIALRYLFKKEPFPIRMASFKNMLRSPYVPATLLLIASAIAVLVAPEKRIALGILKGWIFAPLLYFVLLTAVFHKEKWHKRALQWYALSAIILALWGLYQFFAKDFRTIDGRASGPFESANFLAFYLAPAFLYVGCSAWTHFAEHFRVNKRFFISAFFALVLLGGIVVTKSFGAVLGIFAALVIWLIMEWKKSQPRAKYAFIGLLIVAAGLGFLIFGKDRISAMMNPETRSSYSVRREIWQVAGQFIKEHPILGIGLGQFDREYTKHAKRILGREPTEWLVLHPHNIFLAFWLNTGLLGLLAFLWLLFYCGRYVVKNLRAGKLSMLATFATVMLVYILVHGLIDTTFWKNDLALQFWLIIATILHPAES